MAQKAIPANPWGLNTYFDKFKKIARTKNNRVKGETKRERGYSPTDDAARDEGERPVVPVEH